AGAHRGRLSARARVLDLAQPGSLGHQPLELGLRGVGRAVVDVDELEAPPLRHRCSNLLDQRFNVVGLVPDRNDDRNRRIRGCAYFGHESCALQSMIPKSRYRFSEKTMLPTLRKSG